MKFTRKEVKNLKRVLVAGILRQINSEIGRVTTWVEFNGNETTASLERTLRVDCETEYIPGSWHAGIDNRGWAFSFGIDLNRIDFADEEGKRLLRDMYPEQADFITWAWYN